MDILKKNTYLCTRKSGGRATIKRSVAARKKRRIFTKIWIVIDYFLTFALAKETDDLAGTLVVVAKEIFEIIDIDKQKCSNKRLGNERPNRQLRPLLR